MQQKLYLIAFLAAVVVSACNVQEQQGCARLVKKGFSESDLIGAWDGYVKTTNDSSIVIQEDGRYRQIIHIKPTGYDYEGDWQNWRVTYSDKGVPYLHLEGFLMCAYWYRMDCRTGKTDLEPLRLEDTKDPFTDETYWYDYCEVKWVYTPGEGVFMILGAEARFDQPPRGIWLVPFTKSADGTSGPRYWFRVP